MIHARLSSPVDSDTPSKQDKPKKPHSLSKIHKVTKSKVGFRRAGNMTQPEKDLVVQVVRDSRVELTPAKIGKLANLLRRKRSTIIQCIEEARQQFTEAAEAYADIHLESTVGAMEKGDYETSTRASQWALEHLSHEGKRVIDPPQKEAKEAGPRVVVGIKLGGIGISANEPAIIDGHVTINPEQSTTSRQLEAAISVDTESE